MDSKQATEAPNQAQRLIAQVEQHMRTQRYPLPIHALCAEIRRQARSADDVSSILAALSSGHEAHEHASQKLLDHIDALGDIAEHEAKHQACLARELDPWADTVREPAEADFMPL